jgi:hypothetical protein
VRRYVRHPSAKILRTRVQLRSRKRIWMISGDDSTAQFLASLLGIHDGLDSIRGVLEAVASKRQHEAEKPTPDPRVIVQHAVPRVMTELIRSQFQLIYDGLRPVLEGVAQNSTTSERLNAAIKDLLARYQAMEAAAKNSAEARKGLPDERSLIDHRDRAYDLARQAELLYEDAKNSLDVAMVRRADQQAQTAHRMMLAAHRLNVLAALFFPFATLGAILGTTLTDNWTWSRSAIPFLGYVIAGGIAGLLLTRYISRADR